MLCIGRVVLLRRHSYSSVRALAEAVPLCAVGIASLAVLIVSVTDAIAFRDQTPPGRMYVVEGHRMRIDCEGVGNPTVVLDAGLGNDGLIWSAVQPALATTNRVCSFDRAGYGWSDPMSTRRDAESVSKELHGLLMAASVDGPVVLVGHSIAGLFIRDYAMRYPEEVVGLVFVDASVPPGGNPPGVKQPITGKKSLQESRVANVVFAMGLNRLLGACPGSFPGFRLRLTLPRIEGVCREHLPASESEQDNFDLSACEAAAFSTTRLPTLILSRWTMDESWNRKQEGLMALSSHSRRVIAARSGHYLQVDRPALLGEQIRLFIKQVRGEVPEPRELRSTRVE